MKVLVKVHGLQLSVPCGDGRQSCRWLALAVAQRYALAAPHGRCRTREDAHNGHVLAPDKSIADVCKDNEVLTATLQQEVPVNELGAPQFAPWTLKAFFPSAHKQSASNQRTSPRDPLVADAKDVLTSRSASDHKDDADAKASAKPMAAPDAKDLALDEDMKEYARSEMLQQVASGQFQSEMEAEAAFLYDWSRLRADDLLSAVDAKARDAMRDVLLAHFAPLNAAYRHYATGSSETGYGMNGPELAHLCHESGLAELGSPNDQEVVVKAVSKTLRLRDPALTSPVDGGATLSRAGFLHALLRVLMTGSSEPEAVEAKLKDKVAPAVARLTSGPLRDLTHDDRVVAAVLAAKPKLLKLYARYALEFPSSSLPPAAASASSATWPALLSASALQSMLFDCGMFCAGDAEHHELVFRSAIEQSVAGARDAASPETPLVVFAELVEVSARVALAMLSSSDNNGSNSKEHELPPLDAIRLALEALRSLPVKQPAPPALRK